MTERERFEQLLADVLAETAPMRVPDRLVPEILRAARRERRRSRWLALMKEPPMRLSTRAAIGSPVARALWLAMLLSVLATVTAGTIVVGMSILGGPRTIVVDDDGPADAATIVGGVALAKDGDLVLVRPGVYPEQVSITADITLRGDGPDPSAVVIQPPADGVELPPEAATPVRMGATGTANGIYGLHLRETDAIVANLTVLGLPDGIAVVVNGGAPTLSDLVIDIDGPNGTVSLSRLRMGLGLDQGTRATVERIRHEGWFQVDRGSAPTIRDSQLVDTCVVVWGDNTSPTFIGNTVTQCPNGWAFDIGHGADPALEANDIAGPIDIYGDATTAQVRGNKVAGPIRIQPVAIATIEKNDLTNGFTGVSVLGADATIADNRIAGHPEGISVQIGTDDAVSVLRNVIADADVGIVVRGVGLPSVVDNTFCRNDEDLRAPEGSGLTLDGNTLSCDGVPTLPPPA